MREIGAGDEGEWWENGETWLENGDNGDRGVRSVCKCVQVWTRSLHHCKILPCFHPLNLGFLMDSAPFWTHNGALCMAKKEVVKLGWESDPQTN